MRFRPCIDIHDGRVKQIVGSSLRDGTVPVTNFETTLPPSHFASMYKNDRLAGGHVIMLGKGNDAAAFDALAAYPGGLQAGGGITPANASRYLDGGASHVIVTSYVFCNGMLRRDRLYELVQAVGKKRLVLDLSCKRHDDGYVIVTDRWQNETSVVLSKELFGTLGNSCDEFLIHAAHVEGMRRGIDADLVRALHTWTSLPVTYAGGVRSIDDLECAADAGSGTVDITVGSALDLFGGTLSYRAVVEWFAKRFPDNRKIQEYNDTEKEC